MACNKYSYYIYYVIRDITFNERRTAGMEQKQLSGENKPQKITVRRERTM